MPVSLTTIPMVQTMVTKTAQLGLMYPQPLLSNLWYQSRELDLQQPTISLMNSSKSSSVTKFNVTTTKKIMILMSNSRLMLRTEMKVLPLK